MAVDCLAATAGATNLAHPCPDSLQTQPVFVFKKGSSAGRKEMKELVSALPGRWHLAAAHGRSASLGASAPPSLGAPVLHS